MRGFLMGGKMRNVFGEKIPTLPSEIIEYSPLKPCGAKILIAFSGGNDSRVMAHVIRSLGLPYELELVAIETKLGMDGWKQSVIDYSEWIGIPVSFWVGEGRDYYGSYVEAYGWPGNAEHSKIQNRLKGRAYRKMMLANRTGTEGQMKKRGESVWILSGIRKYESQKRMLLKSPYSYREGAQFINPLFYWLNSDIEKYLQQHNIPPAPGKQWDCKCGATVKNAAAEWEEIEEKAPCLRRYLESLDNPMPWEWGEFDSNTSKTLKQIDAGQMWFDDGTIESFPTCINCVRDLV